MKKPKSIQELDLHKQKCADYVFKKVKANPLLHQFCSHYITALTAKGFHDTTPERCLQFLKKQFTCFKTAIESNQNYFSFDQDKLTGNISATIICPDAQFIIFTIENIFKSLGLSITKMYHPLMAYYINKKGHLVSVDLPKKESSLFSLCYVEAFSEDTTIDLTALHQDVASKIQATHFCAQDHAQMKKNLFIVQNQIAQIIPPKRDFQSEWVELLDWLNEENFSMFGYAQFDLQLDGKKTIVKSLDNHNLGILSTDYIQQNKSKLMVELKKHIKKWSTYRSPFIFDSLQFKSPVKRFDDLMRISLKVPNGPNHFIEHNFIGLLKRSSLLAKNTKTPIIKLKIKTIMEQNKFWSSSHKYNQTIRLLNNVPKIELFKTPTENLNEMIQNLLSITNPNDIAFFTRKKIDTSRLFLMGVIPNRLSSDTNISLIIDTLTNLIPNKGVEYLSITDEQFTRLHIYFEQPHLKSYVPNIPQIDIAIQNELQPWADQLKTKLYDQYSKKKAAYLFATYSKHFPGHYKGRRTIEDTIEDISFLETMKQTGNVHSSVKLFKFADSVLSGKAFLLNIYNKKKIDLQQFIPILQNLNIYFHDELTTRAGSLTDISGYIHSFRISFLDSAAYQPAFKDFKQRFIDLLDVIFKKKLPNDPINGIVSCSRCDWKDIFILQAYRNYLIQLKPNYTLSKINLCMLSYPRPIELIAAYFKTKFKYINSSYAQDKQIKAAKLIENQFYDALSAVTDIDDDYILKRLFDLVKHTLRTNYYQHQLDDHCVLSLKIDSGSMISLPPKSYREIFIFSADLEGIHIRFGPVSRGGIRWSNRINDFRSEVLGLAFTQRVKNVVIVPNGSKGGFIIKKEFDRADASQVSEAHYKQFIAGLLSVTDSKIDDKTIRKPKHVVCYDCDDPYLVVAADKGTATFSDVANNISVDKNFWLADAFASGGDTGYNHKELGITAKGAWECVKLHFLEKDKDINKEPFTCIGIGDMSGDVFGNGMLLSKQTKLLAAFNHMHIFIDPDPDPAISWDERKRLFDLPRSTWKDYNPDLISKGGGVFDRGAKAISLSKEIQHLLGIDKTNVNGSELIHALLKAKVELLWFGGIGTYIKSAQESHAQASDLANDSVRIDDIDCQAEIIGEGANLGITQQARINMSQHKIKLNTDFIDNSAGVNISDYEVNLKIFLNVLQQKKVIKSQATRLAYLKKATKAVIDLVLANNIAQHKLLSIEQIRSSYEILHYESLIRSLIAAELLNPKTDIVPSAATFEALDKKNDPLSRPTLAKLQALVKLDVSEQLSTAAILDHAIFQPLYVSYFPKTIIKDFSKFIDKHPLKHVIISTLLTNYIVNNAGILFFTFTAETTGATCAEIAATYMMLDQLVDAQTIRYDILKQKQSITKNYQELIRFENHLNSMVLDALNIKSPLFNLENYSTIKRLYQKFNKTQATSMIDSKLQAVDNLFIDLYSFSPQITPANYNELVQSLKIIHDFFQFNYILTKLYTVNLVSKWEVDQYKILQTMLSKKKHSIIQYCFNQARYKSLNSFDDLTSLYPKGLDYYRLQLEQLKALDTVSLSALTVLINSLDIISLG